MKMRIENWAVNNLSISRKIINQNDIKREGTFTLETSNDFDEEHDRFFVIFKLTLDDQRYDLSVEVVYSFEVTEGKVDDAFKNSHFPKVNAPAIAFPFLRAMISTITLQAGLRPVMLPSINFSKLAEDGRLSGTSGAEEPSDERNPD